MLEWRYGDQLDWRLVVVGLTEDASQYVARGYTPLRSALGRLSFRRYGMPFALEPKPRISATAPACRAIVAARLQSPGSEWAVLRALQLANFTTPLVLEDHSELKDVLGAVSGVDAGELVAAIDSPEVTAAYDADRAETRTAEGSPAALQGKTRISDGPVRFTAPSVVFARNGARFVAGGFQPVEAYDVLVCNLDPTLRREDPPETPAPLLERFGEGLTTQEVAALMAGNNEEPNRVAAEAALLELLVAGSAERIPLGDDALWRAIS